MSSRRTCTVVTIVMDVAIWFIVSVVVSLQTFDKLGLSPVDSGFYCDDRSIRYAYRPDSVSNVMVAAAGTIIPCAIMVLVDGAHVLSSKARVAKGLKFVCMKYIVVIYRTVGIFLSGAIGSLAITEVLKMFSGRLRPHFIDVCQPNMTAINCDKGYIPLSEVQCLGTDESRIMDARKSFPSGHASMMAYAAVYFVIFLQIRFTWRKIALLVPLLQLASISVTCYVSVSRVTDHKHHPSDVIAGAIIGTIVALLVVKYMSYLPQKQRHKMDKSLEHITDATPTKHMTEPTATKDPPELPHSVVEMNHL